MDVKLLAYELDMHKLKCFVAGRLGEARGHTNGGKQGSRFYSDVEPHERNPNGGQEIRRCEIWKSVRQGDFRI